MTPYAGFLNTEGVGSAFMQNEQLWEGMRTISEFDFDFPYHFPYHFLALFFLFKSKRFICQLYISNYLEESIDKIEDSLLNH